MPDLSFSPLGAVQTEPVRYLYLSLIHYIPSAQGLFCLHYHYIYKGLFSTLCFEKYQLYTEHIPRQ